MKLKATFTILLIAFTVSVSAKTVPIDGLLERIDKGASAKFSTQIVKSDKDFFELSQQGSKVKVSGNNYISIAVGINWYLKYYAGIHLSWNGMKVSLPAVLPKITKTERHETDLALRYNFNYCTFSYSMAFWDWNRWQQEIDWMALHGVNIPLAVVGEECVWRKVLLKLGYTKQEADKFVAGPAFLAWWEMNNLEGWGGPNTDNWYKSREALQKKILQRLKEYGMKAVLPGYCGMVPHDAKQKLGLDVDDAGLWNGYQRPANLSPTDKRFNEIATLYYNVLTDMFGKADYYSMDPFHEGGSNENTDFAGAARAIVKAMKQVNPKAVWVVQGWDKNPREQVIDAVAKGDMLVLDLYSEDRPMWGMPSIWQTSYGYKQHDWLFCMLENFGANVGLFGRMDELLGNFYRTRIDPMAKHLKGIGFTMEGIENNAVMFELMSELPWRSEQVQKDQWIRSYCEARYGVKDEVIEKAWLLLVNSIYNCPRTNNQQGTSESIFCGRPSLNTFQASSWSKMQNFYDPADTRRAAQLMASVADKYRGNNNFEYDLVDITRQAISDYARIVYNHAVADYKSFACDDFRNNSNLFLNLLLMQDELLATRPEFRLGRWIEQARSLGATKEEKDWLEWNARTQITTWGNRVCADEGGLRDYAHKEWNGLLKDFYYKRWATYFQKLDDVLRGKPYENIKNGSIVNNTIYDPQPDWYQMEEEWTQQRCGYSSRPEGNAIDVAKKIVEKIFGKGKAAETAKASAAFRMEKLGRGLVVSRNNNGENVLSWRLLSTDDRNVVFDVYRNGEIISKALTGATFMVDANGENDSKYNVVARVGDVIKDSSRIITPWTDTYKNVKLNRPSPVKIEGRECKYLPNDCSVGDVDGDGEYELIVKWDPDNSHDNSHFGKTANVYLDCYRLDGSQLWRIDLGRNIRAGAHYTQILVYDFEGDGKAELLCKTAPGSIDGAGQFVNSAATDAAIKKEDNNKVYVNDMGMIMSGPEYLTVFDGLSGKAIHTVYYNPNRAGEVDTVSEYPNDKNFWGDDHANRSERYLACVAHLGGENPSAVFTRGYYTRSYLWAVDFDGKHLSTRWLHASTTPNNVELGVKRAGKWNWCHIYYNSNTYQTGGACTAFAQGAHNLSVADVDADGRDEITFGSAAIDDDGTVLYSTGLGHGDAQHLSDLIPSRPGLEFMMVHEEWPYGIDVRDARTGEILYREFGSEDTGRGMAADIDSTFEGYEFWSSDKQQVMNSRFEVINKKRLSTIFRIYWDGDLQDELLATSGIGMPVLDYVDDGLHADGRINLYEINSSRSNNWTKGTPCLVADLFGDWREEIILRSADNESINIFTTTIPTKYRYTTLMHDHIYRMGVAWQNVSYNQPPHCAEPLR